MIKRPCFKSEWVVHKTGAGHLLFSESDKYLLRGSIFDELLPLIDGRRSVKDIVGLLKGRVPAAQVLSTLEQLRREGLITESNGQPASKADAFWNLAGADASQVNLRVGATAAALTLSEAPEAEALREVLALLGISISPDASFRIVITRNYLDPSLQTLNADCLRRGIPWMMAKPYGRSHWIGPLFVPRRTGCWMCLSQRLQENEWNPAASVAALPTTTAATVAMIATEAAKWLLAGRNLDVEGQIRTIDTAALRIQTHLLTRRPQCAACGSPRVIAPPGLKPVPLEMLERHVSPITGIVSEPANSGVVAGLSLYAASQHRIVRALAKPLTVSGKGWTDAEARTSCLAEAMERYSAQFHGDEPRITASFHELRGQAIDPRLLMQFSEDQYRRRKWWNARHGGFNWVPEPFDTRVPIEWTKVRSLTGRRYYFVPAAYCYLGYPANFCLSNTNGCAAGSSFEQAVLHGFLELVERDAVSLWWYNRARRPAVDLRSFRMAELAAARKYIGERGRSLHVLDITTDLGIPAFVAVSAGAHSKKILLGTGAHLNAATAVRRALAELIEAVHSRAANEPRALDRSVPVERALDRWLKNASLQNQRYLLPARKEVKTAADYPKLGADDWKNEVRVCLEIARRLGLDVLVLNMTRADIGFPVARVIVPGLRHNWARFAPGRLYDVPAKLGWRKKRLSEFELNPIPYFL